MKNLLLLIGAPGSGKSTFVKDNNLEPYTICPDNIRLQYGSLQMNLAGEQTISQLNEKLVWKQVDDILNFRMSNGLFTVIDATNVNQKYIDNYMNLCDIYRYRLLGIKFEVELQELLNRNKSRESSKKESYKKVPEDVIIRMFNSMNNLKFNSKIKIIQKDELKDIFEVVKIQSLNNYKKIYVIGDIHGVYEPLDNFLNQHYNEECCYIFLGDYIDRGKNNYEVLKRLSELGNNCIFLEGNHERWLWYWLKNREDLIKSNEFLCNTKVELESKNTDKTEIKTMFSNFYRKLRLFCYFEFNNRNFLVNHAGVPTNNIDYISGSALNGTKMVGSYNDFIIIADNFLKNTPDNCYQIYGHRNVNESPIQINDRVFNLEGKVEFGGYLRVVEIEKDNINGLYFPSKECSNFKLVENEANEDLSYIDELRKSKLVKETKLDNNISSFNFTRDSFFKKQWNDLNIKARGLFINTFTGEIVARSYNKFFNLNEREETYQENILKNIKYPVKIYIKENGYLGITGYDSQSKTYLYCSKSTNRGDFALRFKNLLTERQKYTIEKYCELGYSLIFEVIDIENDPHIIKYDKSKVVLLDAIGRNRIETKLSYEKLCDIFYNIFEIKKCVRVINSERDLIKFLEESNYIYNDKIEGYVIEDYNGFKFKLKLKYYNEWKSLRTFKDKLLRKKVYHTNDNIYNVKDYDDFCNWLKNKDIDYLQKDIISIRDEFYMKENLK